MSKKSIGYISLLIILLAPPQLADCQSLRPEVKLSALRQDPNLDIGVEGSFVIAAICRDGIILASDSRGTIYNLRDAQRRPLAYFDGIQKIFPVGASAIAGTGAGMIGNQFTSKIVEEFITATPTVRVDRLLPSFVGYCLWKLPVAKDLIAEQNLLASGYLEGVPTLCYFDQDQVAGPFGCPQSIPAIQSGKTLLSRYTREELARLTAEELANLAIRAIESYAGQGDNWKTIGGPISVLLVSKSEVRWLRNRPAPEPWAYLENLVEVYRKNRSIFTLIPPATRAELDNLLLPDTAIAKATPDNPDIADVERPAAPTGARITVFDGARERR